MRTVEFAAQFFFIIIVQPGTTGRDCRLGVLSFLIFNFASGHCAYRGVYVRQEQ